MCGHNHHRFVLTVAIDLALDSSTAHVNLVRACSRCGLTEVLE